MLLCVAVGMGVEMIGVNTGYLFGDYTYGKILGAKWNGVPWLIGINWFVIVFCAGVITNKLNEWVLKKAGEAMQPSRQMQIFSFVTDAALLTTLFDWVTEPAAIKLGFWKWNANGSIPTYNFFCWFIISALLLTVFRFLTFDKHNQFALHLFIIQILFFLVLQTFL